MLILRKITPWIGLILALLYGYFTNVWFGGGALFPAGDLPLSFRATQFLTSVPGFIIILGLIIFSFKTNKLVAILSLLALLSPYVIMLLVITFNGGNF